jgi:hypothetical protein
MKKVLYRLFRPRIYKRAAELKRKQAARLKRLISVYDELYKWYDIPISWHLQRSAETLKIQPNENARKFLLGLMIGKPDLQEKAKLLPL